jgi:hypothetical protein
MVLHTFNTSTQKVEAGGSKVQDQPGLHSKFKASLSYTVKPSLKKPK